MSDYKTDEILQFIEGQFEAFAEDGGIFDTSPEELRFLADLMDLREALLDPTWPVLTPEQRATWVKVTEDLAALEEAIRQSEDG